MLEYLVQHSSFTVDPTLNSIATGMAADNAANVDKIKLVGQGILGSIVRKKVVEDLSFKKAYQVIMLASRSAIKI